MTGGKRRSFIEGAAILTAAGMLAKAMGFVYRIFLTRIIGTEGIGLYQVAYPIYTTLLVVSRSGIPIALAKLISDKISRGERKEAFQIFNVSRKLSFSVGLFFSILMILLAKPLTIIFKWGPDAFYPVAAIAPAIFFVSIMATYRGFFQGLQDMVPTAISQIVEQFVRMLTMISLAYILVRHSLSLAAAGATFGAVTGAIAGLFVLIFIYYKRRKKIWSFVREDPEAYPDKSRTREIIRDIASLAIPITIGALVQPLMNLVDTIIVPMRLLAGNITAEPMALFGELTGVAMTLVNFPTIITASLATSLVPSIAEAYALQEATQIKRRTQTGLRLTILISLPAAVGLYVLAEPLTTIIFAVPTAARILRITAWSVVFIGLQETSSAILNGMGRTRIPARNLFVGALVNAFFNYTLTANPRFGIRGAAFGTVFGFAVAALLNLIYVKRYTEFKIDIRALVFKPAIAVTIMGIAVKQAFAILNTLFSLFTAYHYVIATFLAVLVGIVAYVLLLFITREIKYNDLLMIPGVGEKIARILKKIGLVRE
ncbi:MAG: polysaccharide biosynthesis C-terminal domain-containing protein [Halanaerobiales bacterium]